MEVHQLEHIFRDAYGQAQSRYETIRREHDGKDDRSFHSDLSEAWIETLAVALHGHERTQCADGEREWVKVFHRKNLEHRDKFLLNEFLHDICIARTGLTRAARHDTDVPVVKRVLWQVESEFDSNTREAAKDFNKLIAGRADRKLFVGPYKGNTPQALSAARSYRSVLRSIRESAEQGREEEWYLGIVPHPARWNRDESHAVRCWRFEFGSNQANWVRP
jgi:hypothetical protein